MKMKIGFNIGESKRENTENIENMVAPEIVADEPVRSVATVRFENGKEYPYYNDEFNLNIGDVVFVDGKLAGSRGDARRNVTQGGVTVNDEKCTDFAKVFTTNDLNAEGALLVKRGKKAFHLFKPE